MKKTGVFGGAFDPPHAGHTAVIKECAERLNLSEILVIPSGGGKHKTIRTPYEHRLNMARLAFEDSAENITKVLDIEKDGNCYTYLTLQKLKKLYDDSQFFIIIGSDQLYDFDKWYRAESLAKEAVIVAVPRHENEYADMLEHATAVGRIRVLNTAVTDVSSSEIREIRELREVKGENTFLNPRVADYISEHKLYGET